MDLPLDDLERRITARLQERGPTTVGSLALDLAEPFGTVLLALEKLRGGMDKRVKVLPGGLWGVTDEYKKQCVPQDNKRTD